MTAEEVLRVMKSRGNPRTAAIFRRHGATGDVWGVSFADLYALQKRFGTDHALAVALWGSGVSDARLLALLIADPSLVTRDQAERWLVGSRWYALVDLVAKLVARAPFAHDALAAWTSSKEDPARACGYGLLSHLLGVGAGPDDAGCARFLDEIARTLHGSPNRARYAMNGALISIGVHRPALRARALEVAAALGVVEVDHGETGCKTPDAAAYIAKTVAHDAERGATKKAPAAKKTAPAAKKKTAPAAKKKTAPAAKKKAPAAKKKTAPAAKKKAAKKKAVVRR
jgi:3-methyladenine DNA glycosylase AlkD